MGAPSPFAIKVFRGFQTGELRRYVVRYRGEMKIRTVAGLLALTVACSAAGAAVARTVVRDGGVIRDSGSTNDLGYTIKVWSDGRTWWAASDKQGTITGAPHPGRVAPALARRFLADAQAARDARASVPACMKSASFGSTLTVLWHGWVSPDLSCPGGDAAARRLRADVLAIRTATGAAGSARSLRLPNEPRRAPAEPSPSPEPPR